MKLKIDDSTYDGIKVRIYTPKQLDQDEFHPFMIFFHGGYSYVQLK